MARVRSLRRGVMLGAFPVSVGVGTASSSRPFADQHYLSTDVAALRRKKDKNA